MEHKYQALNTFYTPHLISQLLVSQLILVSFSATLLSLAHPFSIYAFKDAIPELQSRSLTHALWRSLTSPIWFLKQL